MQFPRFHHGRSAGLRAALLALLTFAMQGLAIGAETSWQLSSPNGRLEVRVEQGDGISYSVQLRGETIIAPSKIDLLVGKSEWIAKQGGEIRATTQSKTEEIDFPVPRKYRQRTVNYNELVLHFPDDSRLAFRAYDDGVAYRWETARAGDIHVTDERAEFLFAGEPHIWFPEEESMFTHQERVYKYEQLKSIGNNRFCSTGTLVDLGEGRKVFISESDLRSYPGMFLRGAGDGVAGLVGKFAPYPLEAKLTDDRSAPVSKAADYLAKTAGTRTFPWRVMIVSENDADLVESELIYELAPPLAIDSADWIKPGKVAWDWWNGIDLTGVDFRAGVNTETYKYFIDFAAEYNLQYILLDEGWTASTTDILHENPDVDLPEIVRYAHEKKVGVLLWVLWNALDEQLDPALERFEKLGVAGIKVDFLQRDDQWMIEYYHRVAKEAAKHHLMVDFHGACKPTGLNRPYPNVMTYEGVNGLEQYKWGDQRANPDQELVLPFIRMVAGPLDFTPGAMRNANRENYRWIVDHPMSLGTRCHQLAMYVVYESPLQMLADSPTAYRKEPQCMKFLSAVPTVWDDTQVLRAQVGEYVVVARRSGDDWFVGAMINWDRRRFDLDLDFLAEGTYRLESWSDGINADRNAQDFSYNSRVVTSGDEISLPLAPGGGWVGILRPTSKLNGAAQ
ncbi:MAG: glycoside hydrolase family 97 protein [Pirellulales bacterium]